MVLVEDLLRTRQVQVVIGVFLPGQTDVGLEVVQLHVELRTLRIQVVKLVSLFVEGALNVVRPVLLTCLVQKLLLLHRLTVTHLSLHVLDLLLQEVVALLLVDILTGLVADVGLQVLQVDLAVQNLHQTEEPFLHGLGPQQVHLLLR